LYLEKQKKGRRKKKESKKGGNSDHESTHIPWAISKGSKNLGGEMVTKKEPRKNAREEGDLGESNSSARCPMR